MQYLRAYAREIEGTDTPDTPITWVASTEGVKADGHDLQADAWDLSRYGQYGPVLWAHDMWGERLPIGKGAAYIEGDRLMVDVSYDTADPFAMQVRSKARKGMVAGSVSWDTKTEGEEIRNQLLEFSMVPVPLDPASLPARQRSAMRDLGLRLLEATGDDDTTNLTAATWTKNIAGKDVLTYQYAGGEWDFHDMSRASTLSHSLTETPTEEVGWLVIASQMVGLYRSVADDAERLSQYRRLEREYKRLHKTPPEFMTTFDLEPFTVVEIRGLFLEGEPELWPEKFTEPLNQRQVDKLAQALTLIQEAMENAEPEPPAPEPEEDSILLDLHTLLADASTTITGVNEHDNDE